ncbi:hypothetical protein H9L14_07435 [Sphingomonas sediminicola]|uniref:Uncharacterized protein n=1 Tax=Sphingomonas sediminicola TaxID=386874 RepID=A0ABX6T4U8_9SPHN|nr:hypothetical protein H9L14_07435 [Sphingomonas sediminicola]
MPHIHGGTYWSAVYYVRAGEGRAVSSCSTTRACPPCACMPRACASRTLDRTCGPRSNRRAA